MYNNSFFKKSIQLHKKKLFYFWKLISRNFFKRCFTLFILNPVVCMKLFFVRCSNKNRCWLLQILYVYFIHCFVIIFWQKEMQRLPVLTSLVSGISKSNAELFWPVIFLFCSGFDWFRTASSSAGGSSEMVDAPLFSLVAFSAQPLKKS